MVAPCRSPASCGMRAHAAELELASRVRHRLTDVAVAQLLGLSIFTIKDKTVLIRRTLQVHTRQPMIDAILAANAPA